jgi:hypothetical protein
MLTVTPGGVDDLDDPAALAAQLEAAASVTPE